MKRFFNSLKTYQKIAGILATIILIIGSVYYFNSSKEAKVYNLDFSLLTQENSDGKEYIRVSGISLPKGHYTLNVGLAIPPGECNGVLNASIYNDVMIHDTYESTDTLQMQSYSYDFDLKMGTDRGRIVFESNESAPLSLAYISFVSDSYIYTDGFLWGIIALLLIPISWIALYFFGKSENKKSLCLVCFIMAVEIIPFVVTEGLIRAIDTNAHMMRIEGIYYGLMDGQFPVVIQPEWNNSYGQLAVLYPNLFLYIPAILRLLRVSQLGVAKFYLLSVVLVSGTVAYVSAKSIFKKDWQIFVTCLAIMADNMRLHDLFTGGKIGGSLLAEVFWPLLVAGIVGVLYKDKKNWVLLGIGMAGVFNCHVTSTSVACIFVFIFSVLSAKRFKDREVLKAIAKAVMLFVGLTLGTIACFSKFYFSDWGQGQLQWRDFLDTLWSVRNPFSDNRWVSAFLLLFICLGTMIFIRLYNGKEVFKNKIVDGYGMKLFVAGFFLLWFSTSYFPWIVLTRIPVVKYYTNMLQSGNRFLSLACCVLAFCIPELFGVIGYIKQNFFLTLIHNKKLVVVCSSLLIMIIVGMYSEEIGYLRDDVVKIYYDEVVGEVEYNNEDYLPSGTMTEWYESDTGYISNESAITSLGYEREGTHTYYSYTNNDEDGYVEFPLFFYDGYVAKDEVNQPVEVCKGDRNRVRVYLDITDTPKIITLWYKVPGILTVTCVISVVAWFVVFIIVGYMGYRKFRNV